MLVTYLYPMSVFTLLSLFSAFIKAHCILRILTFSYTYCKYFPQFMKRFKVE